MGLGIRRFVPWLVVAALGCAAVYAEDPPAPDPMQQNLNGLRALIDEVEASRRAPTPFVQALLRSSAETLRAQLRAAREHPEESGMTAPQIREGRQLLGRLSTLLLRPTIQVLAPWLDALEAREAPVERVDLLPLLSTATALRQRVREIAQQLDPELDRKPSGLVEAENLLKRFYLLDFETAASDLLERTRYWETLSPAPTATELTPVRNQARNLEKDLDQVLADGVAIPDDLVQRVRAAVARAGTLALIPFTESLMPVLVEMESRESALTETELAVVKEKADELTRRIDAVRPGMLDEYDPDAPPACVRARSVLRRLVSLELQPAIDSARQVVSDLEAREEPPTEEELGPLRESAAELRGLILGFQEEQVSRSPEAEPDLIQVARDLLWRFALIDLQRSVDDMAPFVTALEDNKRGPSPEELAELNRLAERMQPKLRAARAKSEAQPSGEELGEGQPEVVVQARDLMRRAAALQPQTLAAAEEGRDAPVTVPFLKWFRFYGSLRLRTFYTADGFSRVDSETSRIGVRLQKGIGKSHELFGRFEIGINPLELADNLPDLGNNPERAKELFPVRLAYAGVEASWGSVLLGKVWSTYWNVAVFTDQLPAYDGLTIGTFNIGDGGTSGTGRTDGTIQYRGATGKFTYAGQMQARNLTPNSRRLADTVGGSAIFRRDDGIDLGAAFSLVRDGVDDPDPDQPRKGDRAFLVGARTKDDLRYLGATLAYTQDHDRDEQGTFFDAIGFEAYGDYLVREKLRLRFVVNGQFPIGGYPGDYRLIYLVAGASYDILERLRVFLLPRVSFSKNSDGSDRGDHAIAMILLYNF